MVREDAQTKARRLLAEGRVTLRTLSDDVILAAVRGDSAAVYRTGWDAGEGWWCSCESVGRCSHLRAVMLVVLEPVCPMQHDRSVGAVGGS